MVRDTALPASVIGRAELDAMAPDHPLFLRHISGHLALCNSKAFEAAGITDETLNPSGGVFRHDGNGRLTRTITDLALAQSEQQSIRFYAMSASILDDRTGYYRILESSQKGTLDITPWLQWFLATLLKSLEQALARIERVLSKARFWQLHRNQALLAEQLKVLNRLLDGGERGFENGINAAQYQAVTKVSKATATRHLGDLLAKGCITRLPGSGRSTRYKIQYTVSAQGNGAAQAPGSNCSAT